MVSSSNKLVVVFLVAIRIFGFGLWISWLWMLFLEGPLLIAAGEKWHIKAGSIFMLFMLCHAGSLLYLGRWLRPRTLLSGKLLRASVAIMSIGPLLLAFVPSFFVSRFGCMALLVTSLSGFGSAVMGGCWLESFSKMRLYEAAMVFAGGTMIAGICTILAAHIPYLAGMTAVALMPVISFFLLMKQDFADSHADFFNPSLGFPAKPFTAKMVIWFALLYTAGGVMLKIVSLEQTYPYLFYLTNGSYVLVCLCAGLALCYKPAIDLRFMYRPVLPFLGIGFILFVAKIEFAILPFLLLQAGFALFDMYTWLLVAYLARFHAKPAEVCCSGLFLITFAIFSGNLVFTLWIALANRASTDLLAMIAGVLCMLAIFVFPDNRETFAAWDAPFADAATQAEFKEIDLPEKGATAVGNGSGALPNVPWLTVREQEVLSLLLKGRNNHFIGEALHISGNTVKYHIRNLYEKFHVKNRQELLDAVEKMNRTE